MATVNRGLASFIDNTFRLSTFTFSPSFSLDGVNYNKNNVFTQFGKCTIHDGHIELPIFMHDPVLNFIKNVVVNHTIDRSQDVNFIIPLVKQGFIYNKRTIDSIFKTLLGQTCAYGLSRVVNNSNNYYGCKGLIVNNDFDPLFLITGVGNYIFDDSDSNKVNKFQFTECRVYIHPKVFMDESDIVHKGILKKIIPYILSNNPTTRLQVYNGSGSIKIDNDQCKIKVIIENVKDRFFKFPTSINPDTKLDFTDEEINDLLVDKVEEVLKQIEP